MMTVVCEGIKDSKQAIQFYYYFFIGVKINVLFNQFFHKEDKKIF